MMKKKVFLTSIAVLAATMALEASAAIPESFREQSTIKIDLAVLDPTITSPQTPFVLERPTSSGTAAEKHSYHSSHRSHSSHSSHYSSRY